MAADKCNHCDGPAEMRSHDLAAFSSEFVRRVRREGGTVNVPGGQLMLPRVFGFCRGVKRALAMLEHAVAADSPGGTRLFLLGQIIHNPWVNDHFSRRGVRILSGREMDRLDEIVTGDDRCVIPAFGIPLPLELRLRRIGCEIVDTTCGDVRRVWVWAQQAVERGFGVLIFGRARHDETVVTKSRLAAEGGRYVVVGDLTEARKLCDMIREAAPDDEFRKVFGAQATNARTIAPFAHLAQVSQTTMLYDETMKVRDLVEGAFRDRFGDEGAKGRMMFQPTVCRATQDRQIAAVELCRSGPELVMVVGGFGSSNTRHLYELARQYAPAYFIETAAGIRSGRELVTIGPDRTHPTTVRGWLPERRPLRIGILAGASSPEIVVGEVLKRLAEVLSKGTR